MRKNIILVSLLICFTWANAQVASSDMIEVKSGSFTMGNSSFSRESPTRTVSVSRFFMSKYAITNAQFAQFLNQYGSTTVKEGDYAGKSLFKENSWGVINNNGTWAAATGYEQFPAIKVTWYGANEFCKWAGGRLPTEAEWEYAAKGGSTQKAYTYSGSNTASVVAWFYDNSGHTNHVVGGRAANSLGLYDMSGNVYQWCSDWFGRYGDFGVSGESDPKGPQNGVSRVIRGGYRSIGSGDLHLSNRESLSPDESYNFVGFRLVRQSLTPVNVVNDDPGIRVYPNPASDYIKISGADEIAKVEILDSEGKIVYRSSDHKETISIREFSCGLYLVKVSTGTTEAIRKIIVKK